MADNASDNELRLVFQRFDENGSGTIDRSEFDQLLDALGSTMSERDREIGFALIDEDSDGSIAFDELARWWDVVSQEGSSSSE